MKYFTPSALCGSVLPRKREKGGVWSRKGSPQRKRGPKFAAYTKSVVAPGKLTGFRLGQHDCLSV